MKQTSDIEVFISYASADRGRVLAVADRLAAAGVSVWVDRQRIEGATRWTEEIVNGIEACKVLILVCSDASMRSWAVKQELQLAGECQKALLPLILEPSRFPAQMRFFLAGWQWIEVLDRPEEQWLPEVMRSLQRAGVHCQLPRSTPKAQESGVEPTRLTWSLESLRSLARFTDQIWPLPADHLSHRGHHSGLRGLGAPQTSVEHGHRLGSRVCLAIESEREGHLLLLDGGPEGIIYCLCPSHFAPDTHLPTGRSHLPQSGSRYSSFVVTGRPGREHLLAILTERPLGLDWMPSDSSIPARVLEQRDIDCLMSKTPRSAGRSVDGAGDLLRRRLRIRCQEPIRPLFLSAFICEICGQEFGTSSPIGYGTCGVGQLRARTIISVTH